MRPFTRAAPRASGTRPSGMPRWPAGAALAVLTIVGVLGAARYVWTFWLYRGFAAPSTPARVVVREHGERRAIAVAPATVSSFDLTTADLGGFVDPVYVVLPPGYSSHPLEHYPTLYLLHGQPGEPQNFLNIGNVQGVEAELVAERRVQPMIIVMPTGSPGFLADTEWVNGIRPGSRWMDFVAHDVVTAVQHRYRAIGDGRARAIGGFSEGAYGALNIALHHVGEFDTIESWSGYMNALQMPALFGSSRATYLANSPSYEVTRRAHDLIATHSYIWMYTGTSEPLSHRATLWFSRELSNLGVAHLYTKAHGTHDWALWREMMPESLEAASQHMSAG